MNCLEFPNAHNAASGQKFFALVYVCHIVLKAKLPDTNFK